MLTCVGSRVPLQVVVLLKSLVTVDAVALLDARVLLDVSVDLSRFVVIIAASRVRALPSAGWKLNH